MRPPTSLSKITLDKNWTYSSPYPPLGFFPFSEGELGNGDCFGLYWPIGREQEEPLVVEMVHDDWEIRPICSSLPHFLTVPEQSDPASPLVCHLTAKELIAADDLEGGRALLERAITILPEYTDALSALCILHLRADRCEQAAEMAIRALMSPPCFGVAHSNLLPWLCSSDEPAHLRDDPIWKRREDLLAAQEVSKGGRGKHDPTYPLLLQSIEEYLAQSAFEKALTLMQSYAESMAMETVSFQERYSFDKNAFLQWQIEISAKLPGGPRNVL